MAKLNINYQHNVNNTLINKIIKIINAITTNNLFTKLKFFGCMNLNCIFTYHNNSL